MGAHLTELIEKTMNRRELVMADLLDATDKGLVTAYAAPTAEDVIAWMRVNPGEAVKVLEGCKVAGPWRLVDESWVRDRFGSPGRVAIVFGNDGDEIEYPDWYVFGAEGGLFRDTVADCKVAADEALAAAGWVLG